MMGTKNRFVVVLWRTLCCGGYHAHIPVLSSLTAEELKADADAKYRKWASSRRQSYLAECEVGDTGLKVDMAELGDNRPLEVLTVDEWFTQYART